MNVLQSFAITFSFHDVKNNSSFVFLLILHIEMYFGRGLLASPGMDSLHPPYPYFLLGQT